MLFNSAVFLWQFLPVCLAAYYIVRPPAKNAVLLVMSLVFYAWGEPGNLLLLIAMSLLNWAGGLLMERFENRRKLVLILCVAGDLGLLGYYKYWGFLTENFNRLFGCSVVVRDIVLPIGISFFTFQAMSYVIDLYRRKISLQKNFFDLTLYISLFPQLIAGPIVRYEDVEKQLHERTQTLQGFAAGIKRFIYGLAKKVIFANTFAVTADRVFTTAPAELSTAAAWLGAVIYALQIYFDFSGYSDMAIGLGKMFGFTFPENFNYPYLSKSIREFWRRWHISLSTWFRDYVYIPLGGSRKGKAFTYLNLMIVFLCTGVWHGANWTFILWGLWHGFFLLAERAFLGRALEKKHAAPIAHVYALAVCLLGWVLFRAEDLTYALGFYRQMFSFTREGISAASLLGGHELLVLAGGTLLCGPVQRMVPSFARRMRDGKTFSAAENLLLAVLYAVCMTAIAAGAYNAFIYFQF